MKLIEESFDGEVAYHSRDPAFIYTCGNHKKEKDSIEHLNSFLLTDFFKQYFTVGKECQCYPLINRPGTISHDYRVDYLLKPTKISVDLGWNMGVVCIEAKRSNINANNTFKQASDYVDSVYKCAGGIKYFISHCFIYPLKLNGGFAQSNAIENRVGNIYFDKYSDTLIFNFERHILKLNKSSVEIRSSIVSDKTGSR